MRPFRTLTEEECYLRCYGDLGSGDSVRVIPDRAPRAGSSVTNEALRDVFEEYLDSREPDAA